MNNYSKSSVLALAIALGLAGCSSFRDGMEGHKDAVARVDGYTLTVEHAARLLSYADEEIAPANPAIVDPFTVTWVVLGAVGIAVLASIMPAIRAARLHPVEALRYE